LPQVGSFIADGIGWVTRAVFIAKIKGQKNSFLVINFRGDKNFICIYRKMYEGSFIGLK